MVSTQDTYSHGFVWVAFTGGFLWIVASSWRKTMQCELAIRVLFGKNKKGYESKRQRRRCQKSNLATSSMKHDGPKLHAAVPRMPGRSIQRGWHRGRRSGQDHVQPSDPFRLSGLDWKCTQRRWERFGFGGFGPDPAALSARGLFLVGRRPGTWPTLNPLAAAY